MTNKDNFHVRFNDFGEGSLNVLVIFYLIVPDYAAELREREDILLKIMDLARGLRIEFAFPTRTLHVESMPATARSGAVAPVSRISSRPRPGGDSADVLWAMRQRHHRSIRPACRLSGETDQQSEE